MSCRAAMQRLLEEAEKYRHMGSTFEPMKAASIVDKLPEKPSSYKLLLEQVTWPKIVTPKIDGIRAIIKDGKLVTRKLLPVPNYHVRSICEAVLQEGMDMELYVPGATYNETQDAIMSDSGRPTFLAGLLDWYGTKGYKQRLSVLEKEVGIEEYIREDYYGTAVVIDAHEVYDVDQYQMLLTEFLDSGYEGACLRDPNGPYKFGRSTANEQYLLKHKLMEDTEATIVGFEELQRNNNAKESDAFGRAKRSSSQIGKSAGGTLGAFILRNDRFGEFRAAPTGSLADRKKVWDERADWIGRTVTVEFMPHGTKDKPRHPRVKGIRRD